MRGDTINVYVEEYGQLLDDSAVLDGLQKMGVQNWGLYTRAFDYFEDFEQDFESNTVVLTLDEYQLLLEDSTLLQALFAAGVNNWDGFDAALVIMGKNNV